MKRPLSYCSYKIAGQNYLMVITARHSHEELYLDVYRESESLSALELGYGIEGRYELIEDREFELELLMKAFPELANLSYVSTNGFQAITLSPSAFSSLAWDGVAVNSGFAIEADPDADLIFCLDKGVCEALSIQVPECEELSFAEIRDNLPDFKGWQLIWISCLGEVQLWAIRGDSQDVSPSSTLNWTRHREDVFFLVAGTARS
jgi:hypothetical protein